MPPTGPFSRPSRHTARWLALALASSIAFVLGITATASAAVTCPNSNPIVNENNCMGAGSTGWQITNGDSGGVVGFAVQPSYNIGSPVQLKIASSNPSGVTVNVSVYRMGYYGGKGGRLVYSASNVSVDNYVNCNAANDTTGEVSCTNWDVSTTIPASALPVSGIYIAKIVNPKTGDDNQILFVIRNDSSNSDVLVKVPTATYQAYNEWPQKSLYCQLSGGADLIGDGCPRALAVSFERPLLNVADEPNYFLHDEYALVNWLESQGYNISYTDSTAIAQNPNSLLSHKVLVIGGHDEYWSGGELAAVKNARDHGVSVASFSANTSYWKIEYEDNFQTIAAYKTVQDGSFGINDPGPDGPTTTFRDPGAPAGSANAPKAGRKGPNTPENALWGNMYIGDNDSVNYPLVVPPADSSGQFAGDRIWRNTGINPNTGASIGSNLVGWEWDAVPNAASSLYSSFLGQEPSGVTQLTKTPVTTDNPEFIQDFGMTYGANPPAGQPAATEAVKYRAASGALVFAAGTIQWPWGLGPYFIPNPGSGNTYFQAPTNTEDPRIQQATYNILSDMGVQPATPSGITVDPNPNAPQPVFTATPSTVVSGSSVSFSAAGTTTPSGTITDYKWDLDGSGNFATDTGTSQTTSHTYTTPGSVTVSLKVTASTGLSTTITHTITVVPPPTAYAKAVEGTNGIQYYWRMGDGTGSSTLASTIGNASAILSGGATPGQPGALVSDSTTSTSFDGVSGAASASLDLSADTSVTVEFWMKWNAYANNDALAMEFTPNFNNNPGGFLVDPNASGINQFGVAIGQGAARNNVYFQRPSAGAWHYYAFVINTAAPGATEITPYVDGQPVTYTKTASGTGAGNFAASSLYWFSRGGSSLFGAGAMQDLAIYKAALPATTIVNHYQTGTNTVPNGPNASFTASPTAVPSGGTISFDGSNSMSTNGAVTDYKWDLDGSGNFATDTGTTPTVSKAYSTPGPVKVSLRITDVAGKTSTVSHTIYVGATTGTPYAQAVLGTSGVINYWRMGDPVGSNVFADAEGSATASAQGGVTQGQPGAIASDSTTSTSFDGSTGAALSPLDLSSDTQLTVEFWMKWSGYANNDSLALEFTPNFNNNPGGFLVDPNAGEQGGQFGIGIGSGSSRNNVYFPRPSANAWHYYAFVINTAAPAATQIIPYVDGQPVAYTKTAAGTGAGPFATSTLYWFSRDANSLFGAGGMQDLALYNQMLGANVIASHYRIGIGTATVGQPDASFKVSPSSISAGTAVTFDGSASSSPDGTITDYKWDLDGSGNYATDTGSAPTLTHTFTTPGPYKIGLKVTDSHGATDTTTTTIAVGASLTTNYAKAVTGTAGLVDYWRMGDTSGTALADPIGSANGALAGGASPGQPGALTGDTTTSTSFDGVSGAASAPLNLSADSKVTIEFWMKWNAFANNDSLAMEFTPNFNNNAGGFLIDPNASGPTQFGVAIGIDGSRNNVYFARPSAGTWHYYAFVIDTAAAGATEITPYVDGQPVSYTKTASGAGAGNFANSTLYWFSRNASSLFGAGAMQDLAIYNAPLAAATILNHYTVGTTG